MNAFLKNNLSWLALVVLPFALYNGYLVLLASPRYVSEAQVIVESEAPALPSGIEGGLLGFGTSLSVIDALQVVEFMRSSSMLEYLDQTLQLRAHYNAQALDHLSRLPADASREDFLKYYRKHVDVSVDEESVLINVKIQGFDPDYAKRLAEAVLTRAEQFVNEVSQSLAREQVAFVESGLENAKTRLQQASSDLVVLQNEKQLLSAEAESLSVSRIIEGLQSELASQKAQLKTLLSYLSSSAPEVNGVRERISALQAQIVSERSRQVGRDPGSLNELTVKFSEQQLAVQIATELYQSSLQTLESARLEASRKVKHLVRLSQPTLPEEALFPRIVFMLVTSFVLLNLAYLVGVLLIATIKDHRD